MNQYNEKCCEKKEEKDTSWEDKDSWCVSFVADCLLAGEENIGKFKNMSHLTEDLRMRIRNEIRQEREVLLKEKHTNLGFIRQYLGELPPDAMVSAKELWEIFNAFAPLMTVEQERELVKSLKKLLK